MQTRIDLKFKALNETGHKGFMAYITAGDPSLSATIEIVHRLEDAGVDIVELGIPFSDPLADGRVNQESAIRALKSGTSLKKVLEAVSKIRKKSEIPILFYSYMNPLCAYGIEKFAHHAYQAGVDGMLTLDLPVEEAGNVHDICDQHKLNHICLVTPTSPKTRIQKIVKASTGFVYCVSRMGVTGMTDRIETDVAKLIRLTKEQTPLPVALGFGISTPQQAQEAAKMADAIVVGSAIVNRFHQESHTAKGRALAVNWVKKLVRATKEIV
ncbi:MAG: tryptophan synthase subunit alpha [Kiritimatiellae bacterium]|nr:tryptophan synthase subunit alpha [Kiritimatiellia bacterium]